MTKNNNVLKCEVCSGLGRCHRRFLCLGNGISRSLKTFVGSISFNLVKSKCINQITLLTWVMGLKSLLIFDVQGIWGDSAAWNILIHTPTRHGSDLPKILGIFERPKIGKCKKISSGWMWTQALDLLVLRAKAPPSHVFGSCSGSGTLLIQSLPNYR